MRNCLVEMPSSTGLFVKGKKLLPKFHFACGYTLAQRCHGKRAVLKPSFAEHGHFHSGDLLYALAHDFTFQLIEPFDVVVGQFNERNSFGHFNDARARKWTKTFESKMASRCI